MADTDLVVFLRARLHEDEVRYREKTKDADWARNSPDYNESYIVAEAERALADLDSKRQIINLCESAVEAGEIKPFTTWNDGATGAEVGEAVLHLLALPYADHSDYDPAWEISSRGM